MSSNRALGWGLIGLGAALGGIMLLWLLVTLAAGETSPGGAILGLLLAAVLGLPLAGAGAFVLSRGHQEEAAAVEFRQQRRTLEEDRLFRAELRRELEQLARRLGPLGGRAAQLAARLDDLVDDLNRPGYDQAAWFESVEVGLADREALERYDDLLTSGVRRLTEQIQRLDGSDAAARELEDTLVTVERNLAARSDLLRGRRAASVGPGALARARSAGDSLDVSALKLGDAVSYDGRDYLVETRVSYFSDGKTWLLHRLVAEQDEAWLAVSPGGLDLALLRPIEPPPSPGPTELQLEGSDFRLIETFTAAGRVETRGGPESSGAVTVWRYADASQTLAWVEQWSDRNLAYRGPSIRPSALEVWPAEAPPTTGGERGLPRSL